MIAAAKAAELAKIANDEMDDASTENLDDLKLEAQRILDTSGAELAGLCQQLVE